MGLRNVYKYNVVALFGVRRSLFYGKFLNGWVYKGVFYKFLGGVRDPEGMWISQQKR